MRPRGAMPMVAGALCALVATLAAAWPAEAARDGPLAFGMDFTGCEPGNPFPEGCMYLFGSGVFAIAPRARTLRRFREEQWSGGASFSPDGRSIAYATAEGLHLLPASGQGTPVPVADTAGARDPVWSPDGGQLVFEAGENLVAIRPDGSDRRLLGNGREPSWSSAGLIAFTRGRDVLIMRGDGTGVRRLARLRRDAVLRDLDWSPDGKQLAIASWEGIRACRGYSVCVVDIASGRFRGVLTAKRIAAAVAWAPTGATIAGAALRETRNDDAFHALYVVPSRGGSPRRILDERRVPHEEGEGAFRWLAWRSLPGRAR